MNSHPQVAPMFTPGLHKANALINFLAAALLPLASPCTAQEPAKPPLDQQHQRQLIERISIVLNERYVFPDTARLMMAALANAERRGAFIGRSTPEAFAHSVTTLLRSISHDGHLWIEVSPGEYPEPIERPDPQADEARRRRLSASNFGIPQVEILPGNVGYLQVHQFVTPELSTNAAAVAFEFLANADALILDLRGSGGGSPDMVALIASYLFGETPVHLFDIYRRPQDRRDEYWTDRFAPRLRFPHQPVYVLTDARLFSAGEGLAYTLQDLRRATVVGEKTAGGAHPGSFHRLSEDLVMFVAEARVTSAASGKNWQGVGVVPDVEITTALALDTAHLLALDTLLKLDTAGVMVDERKQAAQEIRQRLKSAPIIRY